MLLLLMTGVFLAIPWQHGPYHTHTQGPRPGTDLLSCSDQSILTTLSIGTIKINVNAGQLIHDKAQPIPPSGRI